MPKIYLSPSTQEYNLTLSGNSEEYYMISDEVIATDGNNVGIYQYEIDDKCFRGWTDDGIKCENEITHWMPLPKPFREEKTNE